MSSRKEMLRAAVASLTAAGVPDAEIDAWYLFEYVTKMDRSAYFLQMEGTLSPEEQRKLEELVNLRCKRIPLQYITGSQEFMGYSFLVSTATLIPRQDTEILVDEVRKEADGKRVLDLCTGTGCILLSLVKLCRLAEAVGTDISPEAVKTAEENARRLEAEAKFYCGDLFEAVPEGARFDILVSNPPYIPSAVLDTLQPEVREHEPLRALDGDTDGLKFYREIIKKAKNYLTDQGQIFFEIGCEQGAEVSGFLSAAGFHKIRVIKDLAGLDRVVTATLA